MKHVNHRGKPDVETLGAVLCALTLCCLSLCSRRPDRSSPPFSWENWSKRWDQAALTTEKYSVVSVVFRRSCGKKPPQNKIVCSPWSPAGLTAFLRKSLKIWKWWGLNWVENTKSSQETCCHFYACLFPSLLLSLVAHTLAQTICHTGPMRLNFKSS